MNVKTASAALNPNVDNLDTPAIPLACSWADEYDSKHGPLIDLSQAVPNYPPHQDLLAQLALTSGDPANCGYGDIEGEPELRNAYSEYVSKQYQTSILPGQVHITSGCNQAFFASLLAVTRPGSQVVMANPCYFNQEATARVLGLGVRFVDCDSQSGFLPSASAFDHAIDETVSAVALVSPNNPTGAVYSPDLLREILKICQAKKVWLILDETYREFASQENGSLHHLFEGADWSENLIQLYSFSKAFCIPGHRLGAVVAGSRVVEAIAKVLDNLQICAPRPAQMALAHQIPKLGDWVRRNNSLIAERAQVFTEVINQSAGWEIRSIGGYFAYVEHPYPSITSSNLVQKMASEFGVLPLPGSFFGNRQDQYMRMAFANADIETLQLLKPRLALLSHSS